MDFWVISMVNVAKELTTGDTNMMNEFCHGNVCVCVLGLFSVEITSGLIKYYLNFVRRCVVGHTHTHPHNVRIIFYCGKVYGKKILFVPKISDLGGSMS